MTSSDDSILHTSVGKLEVYSKIQGVVRTLFLIRWVLDLNPWIISLGLVKLWIIAVYKYEKGAIFFCRKKQSSFFKLLLAIFKSLFSSDVDSDSVGSAFIWFQRYMKGKAEFNLASLFFSWKIIFFKSEHKKFANLCLGTVLKIHFFLDF